MIKKLMSSFFIAAAMGLLSGNSIAEELLEEMGLRIIIEVDKSDLGFDNFTADLIMILKNNDGQESVREMHNKTLEVIGDGDKSLLLFNTPADIKGTAMLTFSHGIEPDDQWLYFPALKRVKRINSSNKSGPFMGSEFAFEDFSSQEIEKYKYKYIRQESCGESLMCHVIESVPVYKYSGYSRLISWIDIKEYRTLKVEYYDRKNTLLKTLFSSKFNQYLDKYWRASHMAMKNHATGKSTVLKWDNYKFRVGLNSRDFNKNALSR